MISWVCGKAFQLRGTSIVIVMCLSDFNTYLHALHHQRHVFPVTACLQADENVQLKRNLQYCVQVVCCPKYSAGHK